MSPDLGGIDAVELDPEGFRERHGGPQAGGVCPGAHGTPAAGTSPGSAWFYLVEVMTEKNIAKCVTCGTELHPERARKYDYCMSPECQAKNLKGLTMVAVGVNKSAEQYLLLDDETKAELADGKYHDQRRGTFGRTAPAPAK